MKAKTFAATIVGLFGVAGFAFGFSLHPSDVTDHHKSISLPRIPSSTRAREVYAVWYDVPRESLARRRAGKTELTAAHNRLPIGTLVRVTNLKNDKSVLVRITDRGITDKRAKIDICREAAEQIGILREGIARVLIEVLADPPQANASESGQVAAH
jgi:rare lipoprotein A (peptidoglycan hydrolase)